MAFLKMDKKIVISTSFSNYLYEPGGTNKVILSQQNLLNSCGFDYVYFYPHKKDNNKGILWGIVCNGRFGLLCTSSDLLNYLNYLNSQEGTIVSFYIHHLLDSDRELISNIVLSLNCRIYFYLHDYYLICLSPQLLNPEGMLCEKLMFDFDSCSNCGFYDNAASINAFV